ncbi:MAG: restriction endonuclease subunit S [Magnetococcales bacterium]|nr:restriction endonuclease subunit S [Magnetococcales bacterium]
MTRKFACRTVPSTWMAQNGRRLDCGPYMSGGIEAREILKKHRTIPLNELTEKRKGGIFNGPRFSRDYVGDPAYGVPFLGSTDILHADLSNMPLLSKKQISNIPDLIIREGWTLITCSGTIGRMAYARADMDGMAGSQHFMRVVPDQNKVKPGYLYAYLSSRFGVPIVITGTYGSIIQSIEPHHIADLPVPRLGEVEEQAHALVQRAADLRTEANRMLGEQTKSLEKEIGGGPVEWECRLPQSFAVGTRTIKSAFIRLDAFHHIGFVGEAESKVKVSLQEIGSVAKALRPPIFKRVMVDDSGHEFLGGADVMTLDQKSADHISIKTKNIDLFIVKPGQVLFQCVGQRYGIFGRPTLANRNLIGKAVSEHQIRIIPHDRNDAGFISIFLATEFGRRFLMKHSSGTSIPVLQEEGARKIMIYWPSQEHRHKIGTIAEQAWENRALATDLEDQARTLVEDAIEAGGRSWRR